MSAPRRPLTGQDSGPTLPFYEAPTLPPPPESDAAPRPEEPPKPDTATALRELARQVEKAATSIALLDESVRALTRALGDAQPWRSR